MGSLKGVNITRGKLGASDLGNTDGICGLLASGVAVSAASSHSGIKLYETVKLLSVADLESIGIDEEYDKVNKVAVYRHVSEYFRMAGEGNVLYLMLYDGEQDEVFDDGGPARQLVADSNGDIRVLAVAYTPGADATATDITSLAKIAQAFYDWTYETFRPCQVVLEYNGFSATSAALATDLKALKNGNADIEAFKVSVCIGQDWAYADQFTDKRKSMADVGTMLGCIASKAVNENIGEVATGNLSDAVKGKWTIAGLSNHAKITDWDSMLETLDEKGYIFAISYTGRTGYYWNNDYTCTPIKKDRDGYFNEYTISLGRTLDKCVRGLRNALLPYIKSSQPVDPKTGRLPQALVTNFESIADSAVFYPMVASGEIASGKTTIDPASNLLVSPRVLKVSFVVVPTGQIDEIKGTINLKTSL